MRERLVDVNGARLTVIEAGDRGAPVVLLSHGFPSLGFSWRRIMPALAEAGYHVLAPDQRGYGGSSCPDNVGAYDTVSLTADLVGLLDDVDAERAVWVGHDLGGMLVWNAAQLHPDRVAAVVGLNFPPAPRGKLPPTEAFRKMVGDSFLYMLYFQEPGVAEVELDRDPARALRRIFSFDLPALADADVALRMITPGPDGFIDRLPEPGALPDWLSTDDFDHYVDKFTRSGFTGPVNWYRNFDRNWKVLANPTTTTISVPTLCIFGTNDPTQGFHSRDRVSQVVTGPYREIILDGAGHWLQEERPEEVSAALIAFLADLP